MRLLLVAYDNEARRLPRHLQRLGDDGGDELPAIGDRIRLEHRQLGIVERREPGRVLVREHGDDAGQRPRGARVDGHDAALGDRALHREGVRHARDGVLVGVFGGAGNFQWAVEAVQRRANGAGRALHTEGHGRASSVRSSSVRAMVWRASGTLKALPGNGCASASSASAARRNRLSTRATAWPRRPPAPGARRAPCRRR